VGISAATAKPRTTARPGARRPTVGEDDECPEERAGRGDNVDAGDGWLQGHRDRLDRRTLHPTTLY